MADILHDFPIFASLEKVFEAVSSPRGLDVWWSKQASGEPVEGTTYALHFGPGYDWKAVVRTCIPHAELEWEMTQADDEWLGTRIGFRLESKDNHTQVYFHHTGWPEASKHYRNSSYCWAMYLRLLKRYVEQGEVVPYEKRLDA